MPNINFSGQFVNDAGGLDVIVYLFQFKEEENTIIYSPAFDLSGYGKTEEEAKQSFETTLCEFFNYTTHKKTLTKELNRLGWNVKTTDLKKRKIKTPGLVDMIQKNDYLQEILNEKQFTKFDQKVSVPC